MNDELPRNVYETIGRFVTGSAAGALGGALGVFIAHKIGLEVNPILIAGPSVAGGVNIVRKQR